MDSWHALELKKQKTLFGFNKKEKSTSENSDVSKS